MATYGTADMAKLQDALRSAHMVKLGYERFTLVSDSTEALEAAKSAIGENGLVVVDDDGDGALTVKIGLTNSN